MSLKSLLGGKKRKEKAQDATETDTPENDPNENAEDLESTETEDPINDKEGDITDDEGDDEILDDEEGEEEEEPQTLQSRKDGRKEVMKIFDLCTLYGKPELAESYVRKGYSASQVRNHLLAKRNRQLKENSNSNVISNRQSARVHSGSGGVVSAVKQKLGMKE